ncbi:DHH family phosphoesterase [Candidatus Nomurabacteria bacterium]|nr:DHH family phosphoesterase [Candidatus Nomurabacteria bacterium]USN44138.1 MAG: DHH family phosphoesterase [Candidatus Woesearchaeota archaeon]
MKKDPLKDIETIRKKFAKAKHPLLFFDADTDGTSSYLQLRRAFPNLKGFPLSKDYKHQQRLALQISSEHDLIGFFDTPDICDELFEAARDKVVVWLDHHVGNSKDWIKKLGILHFNPLNYDLRDHRPTTYWSYLIADMKENLPLVTMGSIADFFLLSVIKELFEYDEKSFRALLRIPAKKRKELFTFLDLHDFADEHVKREREDWIRYLTYDCGLIKYKMFFDMIYKLGDDEAVLSFLESIKEPFLPHFKKELEKNSSSLMVAYREMLGEFETIMKTTLSEEKDLIIAEQRGSNCSYARQVAEELGYRLKHWKVVVAVFQKKDAEWMNISFRGNHFNVLELAQGAASGLSRASGGGHPYACGYKIHQSEYPLFRERLVRSMEEKTKE